LLKFELTLKALLLTRQKIKVDCSHEVIVKGREILSGLNLLWQYRVKVFLTRFISSCLSLLR